MNENIDRRSITRIASTDTLRAPWPKAAAEAARFAAEPRRLPTFFGTPMVAHALSSRVPASARLRSLVSALRGRLAVANHARVVRLPGGLATALRALVRAGFDDSALGNEKSEIVELHPRSEERPRTRRVSDPRADNERRMVQALLSTFPRPARDGSASSPTWMALALYESATPTVWLDPSDSPDARSPNAVATIGIDYRLLIAAGSRTPRDWQSLDAVALTAPAAAWPPRRPRQRTAGEEQQQEQIPAWFVVPLLVPDPWLAEHADAATLAHWARLTGRSGAPDRYWFPETWDRFLEPGRRVGWLTASDVWRPRRGRLASAASPERDEVSGARLAPRRRPLTLTPDLERGVGVPPGYALVHCVGLLSVAVVVDR